jgi:hypothetical protein
VIPATMPVGDRTSLEWISDGVALIAPWIWLVAIDWVLRRIR